MKKSLPVLSNKKNVLSAQAEQMILEKLPVDQKTLRLVTKVLEPKNLKRLAIAAVGGSFLVSFVSSASQNRIYQAMVAREMKKQLDPLRKKLDELEAQNAALWEQNRELLKEMKKKEIKEDVIP